jgi:hypothetical protein
MGTESKMFDSELNAEVLKMLKRRDILGLANSAHLSLLIYNLNTEAEMIVVRFDAARRENPLLETTTPDAWLTAEMMPVVELIRDKVDIAEPILAAAIQRYFRRVAHPIAADGTPGEQQLCTSIEAYLPAVKNLLINLYDRKKSLRAILGIPVAAYSLREALTQRKPSSRMEAVFLEGMNARWKNHRIARTLDEQHLKPRRDKSYTEMLRLNPQGFYSLKSGIKKKYLMM